MWRMPRPRRPLLSKERIVETALGLVDAEGLAALSTRRLAAELGVSGPSLYNHFRTKDEILDAVVDSVSAQVDLSVFEDGRDWRTALGDWAVSYRRALSAHPHVVPLLARGPGRRPAALRLADAVFGALVDAGWPPAQATSVGAAMRYFVMGSALGSFAGGFVDDVDAYDRAAYPRLGQAHLLAERRPLVDDRAFETGLAALLDGLALRYPGGTAREPGTSREAGAGRETGDTVAAVRDASAAQDTVTDVRGAPCEAGATGREARDPATPTPDPAGRVPDPAAHARGAAREGAPDPAAPAQGAGRDARDTTHPARDPAHEARART